MTDAPAHTQQPADEPRSKRPPSTGDVVPLRQATKAWFHISLQTFGGPAGQIAVMQHKLVDEKRWIGQSRFLHALNYCMLLPGPEAQQLAIYTGWLLNGTRGGLIAGTLFVLPGMLALLALSIIYVAFGDTTWSWRHLRRSRAGGDRDRGAGHPPGRQAGPHPPRPGRPRRRGLPRADRVRGPVPDGGSGRRPVRLDRRPVDSRRWPDRRSPGGRRARAAHQRRGPAPQPAVSPPPCSPSW